jgi:hypothetical protein
MKEKIAEVVLLFRSNSLLQMKLLEEIAKLPGHSNLQLFVLDNVVINNVVSMTQPTSAPNSDAW